MKKAFSFYLLFMTLGSLIHAQSYFPLLEKEKVWTVEYADYITLPPVVEQKQYKWEGDTIFNAKIYGDYGSVFLREDTLQKKVYLIEQGDTEECLLYDFTALPGDTIHGCQAQWIMDSITMITLQDGTVRKIYYYHGGIGEQYWIESVGARGGLIELTELIGPPTFELLCLQRSGRYIYGARCDEVTAVHSVLQQYLPVEIFPNPANDFIQVEPALRISHYRIWSINGLVVKEGRFTAGEQISLTNLTNGYYWLELYGANGKWNRAIPFIKGI